MSHFTKYYPQSFNGDLAEVYLPGYLPPRKWRLVFSSLSSGSLTIAWRGLTVLSELKSHVVGSGLIEWDVRLPSDSAHFIRVRWNLEDDPTAGPTNLHWRPIFGAQYWYHGVKKAEWPLSLGQTGQFLGTERNFTQLNTWPNHPFPSEVLSQNNLRFNACRWQDDPSFHPYRF